VNDDIVTRLRNECQCSDDCRAENDPCISMRAADEIERLRTLAERLSVSARHIAYEEYPDTGFGKEAEADYQTFCELYKGWRP